MTPPAEASAATFGQRRLNGPLAAWRRARARAVELATQGHTYEAIAGEVGYANRGTAYRVVRKPLDENVAHAVEEYREVEVTRLIALQAAVWDRAVAGEVEAVAAVLKIVMARVKLLGLGAARPLEGAPRTVVTPATGAEQARGACLPRPGAAQCCRRVAWASARMSLHQDPWEPR